jgi:hypothetical protein
MMVKKRALWIWLDGFELFTKRRRGRVGGQGTCFEESWPKVMLVTALTSVTVPARGLRLLILLTGTPFSGCPSSHRLGPVSRWTHCSPQPPRSLSLPICAGYDRDSSLKAAPACSHTT